MFKSRERRENEHRRRDDKAPANQGRKSEAKPQPVDHETLKQVTGGMLPRTGGW